MKGYTRVNGSGNQYTESQMREAFEAVHTKPMIIIDHERYGERTEFANIAEAQSAIRACRGDFADTTLTVRGSDVIDDRGEIVGEFTAEIPS